jgi:hypothetical protein
MEQRYSVLVETDGWSPKLRGRFLSLSTSVGHRRGRVCVAVDPSGGEPLDGLLTEAVREELGLEATYVIVPISWTPV